MRSNAALVTFTKITCSCCKRAWRKTVFLGVFDNLMHSTTPVFFLDLAAFCGIRAQGLRFRIRAQPCISLDSPSPNPPIYLAAALTLARDLRTSKRACLRRRRTLKRSKSVSARLRSFWARFLAQADSCHLASIPAFSHAALTAPVRAPRGSFSRTSGVRMRRARAIDWRGTAVLESVDGPSIRT